MISKLQFLLGVILEKMLLHSLISRHKLPPCSVLKKKCNTAYNLLSLSQRVGLETLTPASGKRRYTAFAGIDIDCEITIFTGLPANGIPSTTNPTNLPIKS